MELNDLPNCNFKIEIAEKCSSCGGFHISPKKKKTKWHHVKDKLPIRGRWVLTYDATLDNPRHGFAIARYCNDNRWHCMYADYIIVVTHWRELPKPPDNIKD